jgi:hypothetical protein
MTQNWQAPLVPADMCRNADPEQAVLSHKSSWKCLVLFGGRIKRRTEAVHYMDMRPYRRLPLPAAILWLTAGRLPAKWSIHEML